MKTPGRLGETMLQRIALDDFVIVDTCTLELAPGLNVLTGETGAGKSILVDALGLLTGGRASADWVRQGCQALRVEAALDLEPEGRLSRLLEDAGVPIDEEGSLLLRREVGADGRSRAFVNGRQVLVSQLREWTAGPLWIVGQGEQRALLTAAQQEALLDRLAGNPDLSASYRTLRRDYLACHEELEALRGSLETFSAEADWLRFQAQEIRDLSPQQGERDELQSVRKRIENRGRTHEWAEELRARLTENEGSVTDHIETLIHRLRGSEGEPWERIVEILLTAREDLREIEHLLPTEEELEIDPDQIVERLRILDRLLKKYGPDESAVLLHLEEVERRLADGEALESRIAETEEKTESLRSRLGKAAASLSKKRKRAATDLARRVGPELTALGMPAASLEFEFRRQESDDGVTVEGKRCKTHEGGVDQISIRFQSHSAIEWGDLGRVASGGELSRVLLAIQAVLGESAPPGSWVFDEIDQGIGGETALRLGERLARMSARSQILLVTHLPAVAARADRHFRVVKEERDNGPTVRVMEVQGEARLAELARMLSGDPDSTIARRHARELLIPAGDRSAGVR